MTLSTTLDSIATFWTNLWNTLYSAFSDSGVTNGALQLVSDILQLLLPLLAILILVRCGRSLLQGKIETEVWGFLVTSSQEAIPLSHWENLIGRSHRCDVVLNYPTVSRSHAALIRDDRGNWKIFPIQAKNGVLLNGALITEPQPVQDGDLFDMGGLVRRSA